MVEIRMTLGTWEALQAALLSRRDVESKAFVLARALEGEHTVALLAREVIRVPDEAYESRSAARVVIRREFVHALLTRCAVEGLSLIEAHTHPWTRQARFSAIDARSNPRKFLATERIAPAFRHAALVFGGDGSFQGELWDPRRRRAVPVTRMKIIGQRLEIRYGTGQAASDLDAALRTAYDRQVRALGEEGQRLLRSCSVGLVGAGGLGSLIAQALALLGVGRLILVDPDRLEPTNANRLVAVPAEAVRRARPKVEALAEGLRYLCLHPPDILPVCAPATDRQAREALMEADVLIGAVDSPAARQFLNRLSVCALIPYLDGGVGIRATAGRLDAGGGQVRVVLPGAGFCLMCVDREAWERSVEQMSERQRAAEAARGYIRGETIPNPQVVFLNGIVAHLLVWEFVKLVTGCHSVSPYVYYDLLSQRAFTPEGAVRRPECLMCSPAGLLATGREGIGEVPAAEQAAAVPRGKRSRAGSRASPLTDV